MVVFFICSIALSTCMRRETILRVSTCSFALSCAFPLRKGGMFNFTLSKTKSSSISKPQSAITEPPLSSRFRIPHLRVNSLIEMEPGKRSETNITAPDGEMPTVPTLYTCCDFCNWKRSVAITLSDEVVQQRSL